MNDKTYIVKTNFNWDEDIKANMFEKELEFLCLKYGVEIE